MNISLLYPTEDLHRNVECLWQLDILPYKPEKEVIHSKEDEEAIATVVAKKYQSFCWRSTEVHYNTAEQERLSPVSHTSGICHGPSQGKVRRDSSIADTHNKENQKLEKAGCVVKPGPEEVLPCFLSVSLIKLSNKSKISQMYTIKW